MAMSIKNPDVGWVAGQPLLCVGEDFAKTDIELV